MKTPFIDKLIERLDRLDPGSLQTHFLHLAREKGLLETIFHAVQEGIVVLDARARIAYANRAAEKLLGFELAADAGAPMRRYLRAIQWDRVLNLEEGEWARLVSREIEVNYPQHRFLAFYVVPLQDTAPEDAGAVVILRDVTGDRKAEARSLASERLRAVMLLAAGVAHEIGNPLNSLHIHLQLLQRALAGEAAGDRAELAEILDVALREVGRLDRILTQFLTAVRPVPPQLESLDLRPLLRETLDVLRHEIEDRAVLVTAALDEKPPGVKGDRTQLRQAFFNIVKNAVESMPDGGRLTIRLGQTDRFVTVAFADSGEGIPPERLPRVFDAYYSTKDRGSGLGMMVVQRILRDHGGEIEIESEPGRGTTVTLLLPREDRRVRLLKAPRAAARGPSEGAAAAPGEAPQA